MKIVVTGSSSGIGRALVVRLLGEGHVIWGLARSDQSAFADAQNGAFSSSKCDVANWEEVARATAFVEKKWKHVDALVCCAGSLGPVSPAVHADPGLWSATVRANLDGTYYAIRSFHSLLARAPRRAKIVCFSGGGATKARPNFSAYGAAKTAIVRLVETVAAEERDAPFDINAVAPGAIATRLTDEVISLGPDVAGQAEFDSAIKQKSDSGATLERALDMVEWLLSAKSDGISGKLLSAPWDPWQRLFENAVHLERTDVYTLRRIVPEDRGMTF
jgi:NAD(P)-dependent dehydrogenase (short-subunit alcohol dehydrogenase family)